jgi:asparagine synthase (glutamine-hydrolysing)
MCGIFCIFGAGYQSKIKQNILEHRGPDDFNTYANDACYMEFSRLCINDLSLEGRQPFVEEGGGKFLMCNGEIYNHQSMYPSREVGISDCKCLIPLIEKYGISLAANMIRGVFAICYYDGTKLLAVRDPIGVRPLFFTRFKKGSIALASEMKVLNEHFLDSKIEIFPPGHFYDSKLDDFVCYYSCYWKYPKNSLGVRPDIKNMFEQAVKLRLVNTHRQVGFFLSGGLDSSLVAAIGQKYSNEPIKTFSIGLNTESPDCKAARTVAKYLNSDHTEVNFTVAQGIKALRSVIKSLETYDTTTIRASVPMWLLSKYISENTECRVILSGEGSDELFGGYLYFHYAPSQQEFFYENIRRLRLLHQFDVLRADRCTAAHGLELRVPFLDRDFLDHVMQIPQNLKCRKDEIEKWVLRNAFQRDLPSEILWRQKDAFSDAVGHSWVDKIKEYAEIFITNEVFENIKLKAQGHNVPLTKEEALYRHIFWETFGESKHDHLISEIWRTRWIDGQSDPSARYLNNKI